MSYAFNIPFKVESLEKMYREKYNDLIAALNEVVSGNIDPSTFDDADTLVNKLRAANANCEEALNG